MTGDASKWRLFAASVDGAVAFLLALVIGGRIPWSSDEVRWVVAPSVFLLYYFVLEAGFGATLGKRLFGLRVCTAAGERPSYEAVLIRTLARVLEVNPILLGGLPAGLVILFNKRRQRLGGLLSGTFVVRRPR